MDPKKAIHTDRAPVLDQSKFPFSQAISYNGMIYCSGNIGIDPATNKLVAGTITERTVQTLMNLSEILKAGGSRLENIVKVNIFITTMDDFDAMNIGYSQIMPKPFPCRTCVAVRQLPLGTDVEIECIAFVES